MSAVTDERKVLLEIADLKVHFEIKDGKQWFWQPPKTLKAVDGVTLRLYEGETLGVVGESGCGKSTFARAIIGLVKATEGKVAWLGKDLLGMKPDEWRAVRSDIQMIFQDPLASTSLKNSSFKCSLKVEPSGFTSDLPSRLRSLYTQSFRTTLAPYVLPRLLARS